MERGWFSFHDSIFRDKAVVVSGHFGRVGTPPRHAVGTTGEAGDKEMERDERKTEEGKRGVRLIKMQYLQAVPARITRPYPPFDSTFRPHFPRRTARSIFTSTVAPTANGEIMIKPASFQWNDGNYRVGCSRLPVFVHYSEAAYKYLAVEGEKPTAPNRAFIPFPSDYT